jgi:hypothetical protein
MGAFSHCGLIDLALPFRIMTVSAYAFRECRQLTSVVFNTSCVLSVMSGGVFLNCSNLESVLLPDNMTLISNDAFHGCSRLKDLHIPSNVTLIGIRAFKGCEALERIVFSSELKLKCILESAFFGCGLHEMFIPDTVEIIDCEAFSNCVNLVTVRFGAESNISFLESGMFSHCTQLSSVHLPPDLIEIGDDLFLGCSSLQTIALPKSLVLFGPGSFRDSGITSLDFSSIAEIGESALVGVKLDNATFGRDLHLMGNRAFQDCVNLASVTFDKNCDFGCLSIAAFERCSHLTVISLPESMTTVGDNAFAECEELMYITLPEELKFINNSAFWKSGVVSIIIPDSVSYVGEGAFENCRHLQSISFSSKSNVTRFEWGAFRGCKSLTNISFPGSLKSIGSLAFWGCDSLEIILLPSGLNVIEEYGLSTTKVSTLRLPDSLVDVSSGAFGLNSELKSMSLGNGFAVFAFDAFVGCTSLAQLHLRGSMINPVICPAIQYEGFPRHGDVDITVDAGCQNHTVCGEPPGPRSTRTVSKKPTDSPTRSTVPHSTLLPTSTVLPRSTLLPTATPLSTPSRSPEATKKAKGKISTGALLGISTGSVVIVAVIVVICVVVFFKRRESIVLESVREGLDPDRHFEMISRV